MEVRGHASNRVRLHDHLLTIVTEPRMPERELVLAERQGQVRDWGSSDRLPVDGDFGPRRSVQIDPAVRRRHIQRDRLPGLDIQLLPELVSQPPGADPISRSFSKICTSIGEDTWILPDAFCPVFAAAALADGVESTTRTQRMSGATVRRSGDPVTERPSTTTSAPDSVVSTTIGAGGMNHSRYTSPAMTTASPAESMASAATAGPNVRVRPDARGFARSGWARSTGRGSAERSAARLRTGARLPAVGS